MPTLGRSDITGKTISAVLRSPMQEFSSGYAAARGAVRLVDGTTFAINSEWDSTEIVKIQVDPSWKQIFDGGEENCVGDRIEEVLFCDQWGPYLIILLSSGRVLTITASPWLEEPVLMPRADFAVVSRETAGFSLDGAEDFWKRAAFSEKY